MEPQPPPGAEGAEGAEGGATGEPGTSPASIVKDYVRYLGTCPPSPRNLPSPRLAHGLPRR